MRHSAILNTSNININTSINIGHLQNGQLGVVLEDFRWQFLYLVVFQVPRRRIYPRLSKAEHYPSCLFLLSVIFIPGESITLATILVYTDLGVNFTPRGH